MATPSDQLWPYIERSIDRLLGVLGDLPDEVARRWKPPVPDANSVRTLVTHVLGNLECNLVGVAGGRRVERDRPAEFSETPLTAADAGLPWADLRDAVRATVERLDWRALQEHVMHDHRGVITRLEVLVIVARHAAEHLGQAELTRDLYLASHKPRPRR